jgi:hypothetical protein
MTKLTHKITIVSVENGYLVTHEYVEANVNMSQVYVYQFVERTRKELHDRIDECLKVGEKCPLAS